MKITPAIATKPGDKASKGSASLISRFLIADITHRNAAAPRTALINKIIIEKEKTNSYWTKKKNGNENKRVTTDTKKEKFSAPIENNVFFSETAAAAENNAEINASKNQFIF